MSESLPDPAAAPDAASSPASSRPVVLVTGGARRLGARLCRTLATTGAHVLCHYQHSRDEALALVASLREAGAPADAVAGALDTIGAVDALFDAALAVTGRIDAIVNNASIFDDDAGVEPSAAALDAHWQVNLRAPLWIGARLARHARERGVQAALVQILDQKIANLNPDYFSYTVSKLGLAASVPLQAQALAPHVRVVGIAPGLLALSGPQQPANFDWASRQNLLRRPVALDDVARATVDAMFNRSITGTTIHVDCGQHLMAQPRDVMFLGPDPAPEILRAFAATLATPAAPRPAGAAPGGVAPEPPAAAPAVGPEPSR